jgi:hypothetical protein
MSTENEAGMKVYSQIVALLWTLSFWTFIAVKVAGHSFDAWRWWWVLMPPVPIIGLAVKFLGL